jgi:hypothetical protein
MKTTLEEDSYLSIQLLSYDKHTMLSERFYFLAMSTLQATKLLPKEKKILSVKIEVLKGLKEIYVDDSTLPNFKTIGEFNDFFLINSNYSIHNCDMELDNGLMIGSHDDGEVSIQFEEKSDGNDLVNAIFRKFDLDLSLIGLLKSKPGHYISIDKHGKVTADFETFDDYLSYGRNDAIK